MTEDNSLQREEILLRREDEAEARRYLVGTPKPEPGRCDHGVRLTAHCWWCDHGARWANQHHGGHTA